MSSRFPPLLPQHIGVTIYRTDAVVDLAELAAQLSDLVERVQATCERSRQIRQNSERICLRELNATGQRVSSS